MANRARLVTMLISLALLAGVGCSTAESPTPEPSTTTVWISGGWLNQDPDAVLRSVDSNSIVVRARVTNVDAPRSHDLPDTGRMAFTPVNFVVTESLRGEARPDDQLTLRILGGTVDGVGYVVDDAPSLDAFSIGDEFLLFTQEVVTLDGLAAATPNHAYRIKDGRAVDAFEGRHSVELTQFLADLRARLGL